MPIRPDLKVRHDAALNQSQTALAEGKGPEQVAAAERAALEAAEVFAGSQDAEELDLRHTAFLHAAGAYRTAGRLAEAEQRFACASDIARAEAGEGTRVQVIGRYFTGLMRQQQQNDAGAAEALREAYHVSRRNPGSVGETRLIGAALGLSLLRLRDWKETASVLGEVGNPQIADESEASIQNNRALALQRAGRPAEALEAAHYAVGIREKVSGKGHPLTIETALILAAILVDNGQEEAAAQTIREAAAVILAGPGEAHPFFARALLAMGRRCTLLGDGAAAEALARRARFLLDNYGVSGHAREEYDWEANEIPFLWRTRRPAAGPQDIRLWRVDFQHTLRRYQVATLDYAGAGDMPKTWYLFVPASCDARNAAEVLHLMHVVMADENIKLNAREPSDANFIDVTSATATEVRPEVLASVPPGTLFPQRSWEGTASYSLAKGGVSQALAPLDFGVALHAYAALHGQRLPVVPWVELGFAEADLNLAASSPLEVLGRVVQVA